MRILIAEDEKALNRILVKQFAKLGYSVDSCFDGDSVFDFLAVNLVPFMFHILVPEFVKPVDGVIIQYFIHRNMVIKLICEFIIAFIIYPIQISSVPVR